MNISHAVFWTFVIIAAICVEAATTELVAIWFVPGAIAAIVLSPFIDSFWIQGLVFVSLSILVLLVASATIRKKILKNIGTEKTDTDLLIGKVAKVEEEIVNSEEKGAVKVDNKIWSARLVDGNERASPGEFVVIESISGVKLMCRKKEES